MINAALEGEEVVITRSGKDTVKLVPANTGEKKDRWIGMWKEKIQIPNSYFESLNEFDEFV